MFATLKLLTIYICLGSVAGLIGIPYTLVIGDITRLYRVGIWITRMGVRAAGIRVEASGLEHVPAGRSCIFMCNHVSNLDPPIVMPLVPGRGSVLLKKSLMKIPLLGPAMRMAKFVPVERSSSREAARQSVAMAADALRSGLHILVFPEGTRSLNGRLSTFKKGPFFLARETQAPIIPVALSGTYQMLPKGSNAIRPGVAHVRFLPPIETSDYASREDLMIAVRRAIAEALPPEMAPELT
jgi:1-acyl-sn-glycerol-3-phosphate acyltransferase